MIFLNGGGRIKAKTKKSVTLQQIFIQKALRAVKGGKKGGKSIHCLKAPFMTYSQINVWWPLLSE